MMIMQAVEKCGREWHSMAQFMKKHSDVLGKAGDYYKNMPTNDKKSLERLRKRANKILSEKTLVQSQSRKRSNIDVEYHSDILSSGSDDTSEEAQPPKAIEEEMSQVSRRIKERDTKYIIDRTEHMAELDEPSSALQVVKRKREEERREDKFNTNGIDKACFQEFQGYFQFCDVLDKRPQRDPVQRVANLNPYTTKMGSTQRSSIWEKVTDTLNIRLVREHVGNLITKHKRKLRAEDLQEMNAEKKGKLERDRAKAEDVRMKAMEKLSETKKRADVNNELKQQDLQLRKEQQALEKEIMEATSNQQARTQEQQMEMLKVMQQQQQQQQQFMLQQQSMALMALIEKMANK
ncbi:hypothetical protein OS493_012822 [Desmophyllum pertusum]|uniref:Uncharacterized protein n=1 Tax=Desmophyllum pertusum TaxID=174260 RepID=A0A9W9Z2P6_9CNID|nr:hypothetical protein OS493_012822 [Desmophyllum pertusum]